MSKSDLAREGSFAVDVNHEECWGRGMGEGDGGGRWGREMGEGASKVDKIRCKNRWGGREGELDKIDFNFRMAREGEEGGLEKWLGVFVNFRNI